MISYEDFKKFLLQYKDFTEEELREMYEAEMLVEQGDLQEVYIMKKQVNQFAVETKNGVVQRVGRSVIFTPKTNFQGGEIKFYDDSKLLKKNQKNNG